MRIFNTNVLDSYVSSASQNTYSDPQFDAMLGAAEKMSIQVVADQISGTTPTITVQIEHSSDRRNWNNKNGTAEVNGATLTAASTDFAVYGQDTGSVPGLGFSRVRVSLGGTTPGARIRVFCTGHAENQY